METQMKLEHKIELRWLILFALPTIFSNIFGNLYTAVDGIFVARFVDTDALSAINISMPMAYLASALGMMFGTGGNALIAKKIGEGKQQEALEDFSLLMAVAFLFGLVLSALCFIFLDPLCRFLGSDEALLHYCRQYMIPGLISIPFAVFGMMFQLSFITVGKAGLGAFLSVLGGVLNIMLDWLFMGKFDWGLIGAAIVFMVIPVLVLPQIFEMDGVWLSISAGEMLSLAMSIYYFVKFRDMWRASKPSDAEAQKRRNLC